MIRFCPTCGAACVERIPTGEDRPRAVCAGCAQIHYRNPRVVVTTVATWEGRVLLCRRAIEPRRGFWTIPGGFLEVGETTRAGAEREAREEAGVAVRLGALLAVYELPHVEQVQLVYRGSLPGPALAPGVESLEARLFDPADIPWDELAFPTVGWALRYHLQLGEQLVYPPHSNPSEERLPERPPE